MFIYMVLKPTGSGDREVELLLQNERLKIERTQLEYQYEELQNNIDRLELNLIQDSIFVFDASPVQLDSMFADYFGQRDVLHSGRGPNNPDRPTDDPR